MTTGRINQVTILTRSPHAPKGGGRPEDPPEGRSGSLSRSGGGRSQTPGPGYPEPKPGRKPASTGHPIAPTEFPKGWSAADARAFDLKGQPALRHTPLKRRIPAARHARRRLRASVDPQMSLDNDSHRPFIHRLLQSPRSIAPVGLRATLVRPRRRTQQRVTG